MANVIVNDTNLTDIANAIRDKNGETTTYKPSEMATAIGKIDTQDNSVLNGLIDRSITAISNNEVTKVGAYLFTSCNALKTADFPSATVVDNYCFYYAEYLENVNMPLIKTLGIGSFYACSKSLAKLDFPSLTSMGSLAFAYCRKLETLILRSASVVTMSATTSFEYTLIESGTGYIYVPSDLVDSYKSATNWSTYAEQIRAIEDYPEITGG